MYFPHYLPPLLYSPHQPLARPRVQLPPCALFLAVHIHMPPRTNLEYITPLNTKQMSTGTGMKSSRSDATRGTYAYT